MNAQRIAIVGGGFSGASAAVQMARKLPGPLRITVVEPAAEIGPGLAYSTEDPAFRLNAIGMAHSIDVADPEHFNRWCEAQGLPASDPEGYVPSGQPFARRRDFGRYLAETVREHAAMPNGTTIEHRHARVTDIDLGEDEARLTLDDGGELAADQVILATGNPAPRRPAFLGGELAGHPAVIANPLVEGLDKVAPDAAVLVVGAGLTALDMVASLLGRGHQGPITVISRHGLRPQPQPPAILAVPPDPPPPPVIPLEVMHGPLPPYLDGESLTALGIFKGLRAHVREVAAEGLPWQAAFDFIALALFRIWPRLPLDEKRRVLRHLRPFYDAHRFRTPPLTEAAVRRGEDAGRVEYLAAAFAGAGPADNGGLDVRLHLRGNGEVARHFDTLVNCTGLDTVGMVESNPLLKKLADRGTLVPHPTGLGVVTDGTCRAVAADGSVEPRLRVIGPPTAGMFGDPLGVFFIAAQIDRMLPALAADMIA